MPVENGLYFFYQEQAGGGLPLVLIHGAGGSHLSWPPGLRRLSGQEVYALDLPGHGKSAGHGEQTLGAYADHVAGWMDRRELSRAFFLGHSMGGGIALEMALRHPHRAAGIGLISSGGRLPVSRNLLDYSQNESTFPSALEILRGASFGSGASSRLVDLVIHRLSEVRPSVLHNDFLACVGFDAIERLEAVRCPTLVVCGSDDRMAPLRMSQFLASKIAGAEFKVIPEAGHLVMLEKPGEVAEIVAAFLKKQLRRF